MWQIDRTYSAILNSKNLLTYANENNFILKSDEK